MSLGVLPWVYPVSNSLGFLDLGGCFLTHFRDVFNYYLLKYFLMVFLLVFFWDSYDSNVEAFYKFLEKYNLPKLSQEEMENLNTQGPSQLWKLKL